MRLICLNEDCEHTCADYEAAGPYAAPECPKCWSPMEPFIAPEVSFAMNEPDMMFAIPSKQPAEEIVPVVNFRIRQAS